MDESLSPFSMVLASPEIDIEGALTLTYCESLSFVALPRRSVAVTVPPYVSHPYSVTDALYEELPDGTVMSF